ncbi:hypothetical protein OFM52_31380, partial [Escherichia coli]|nr:hypothetical protein [Escherichia coli]
ANNYHGINMLYQQLQAHCQKISELPDALNAIVQEQQRDANRSFARTIQTQMERTYQACAEERGTWLTGTFE